MSSKLRILLITLSMVVAGGIGWVLSDWMLSGQGGGSLVDRGKPAIGGPFELTDGDGKTWSDKDFRGKLMLIYFGYAYCPDVCPTSLAAAGVALEQLGRDAAKVAPIFITVDPERDNGQALKEYAAAFYPSMIGLGGAPEAIASAARAYRVYFTRTTPTDGSAYLVDHSSILYLMGKDGVFLTHFTHNSTPEEIAAGLRRHL